MKIYTIAATLALLFSANSAFAASQINSEQAMNQQHIGSIRVQIPNGTLDQSVERSSAENGSTRGELLPYYWSRDSRHGQQCYCYR